jgi:hypothetical protein
MPPTQQEKNKQDSKDKAIVIVDDEEGNKSNDGTTLVDEGIKDELKEETRVVQDIQDIEQGDEDIEEEES